MMSRSLLLRVTPIAILGVGALALTLDGGGVATPGRAEITPVVLGPSADTPEPPAQATATSTSGPAAPPDKTPLVGPRHAQAPVSSAAVSDFGLPCGLSVSAEAMPGAMVALDIMAPCRPGARVEITHAGLAIDAHIDAVGLLTVDFPAFETPAFFTVRLEDGDEAVTMTGLPDLSLITRVAVTWQGGGQIELHAFEGNAAFGDNGHIWREAPADPGRVAMGTGGFMTLLGDATLEQARRAEVYSFPRNLPEAPRLTVDIPITGDSCGRPMRATTLELDPDGTVAQLPVSLTLPGCDAVGDYLVLQNLFGDRRLASN